MDPRLCEQLSPVFPKLACHFPWEYHNHFDKGLGWSYFDRTVFAHWKVSDCDRTSKAVSVSVSAAEI
eukprot:7715248-Heterocapsa_arctica.AAC.1